MPDRFLSFKDLKSEAYKNAPYSAPMFVTVEFSNDNSDPLLRYIPPPFLALPPSNRFPLKLAIAAFSIAMNPPKVPLL